MELALHCFLFLVNFVVNVKVMSFCLLTLQCSDQFWRNDVFQENSGGGLRVAEIGGTVA